MQDVVVSFLLLQLEVLCLQLRNDDILLVLLYLRFILLVLYSLSLQDFVATSLICRR